MTAMAAQSTILNELRTRKVHGARRKGMGVRDYSILCLSYD